MAHPNRSLNEMRRWLEPGEHPTMMYYFKIYTGERGEADSPLALFDLLVHPAYSDCDDRATHLIMLGEFLRDVAAFHLGSNRMRAIVLDGVGPLFDNALPRFQDEREELKDIEFENYDSPFLLDFWDEFTVITSLIRCGYMQLYERVPTFRSNHQENSCYSCHFFDKENNSCNAWQASNVSGRLDKSCPFWTKVSKAGRYLEATPEVIANEPTWKKNYKPVADRHFIYPLYQDPEKLRQILEMDQGSLGELEEE